MRQFFLSLTGTVLVLNIMLLLIPDGKYEKYVKYVAGVIVLLNIASNLFSVKIDHDILNFDQNAFSYNSEKLDKTVKEQVVKSSLTEKILSETSILTEIEVVLNEDKITRITVKNGKEKENEIKDLIVRECDINRSQIVIQ